MANAAGKAEILEENTTGLAQIDVARNALAQIKSLSDAIEVRNRATAIAAYARAKGADEAHSLALEVKLRAERKAGGFLIEMKEQGELLAHRSKEVSQVVTLPDLGIERMESVRWQRIAEVPEAEFEDYLSKTRSRTQASLLILAARYQVPSPVETSLFPKDKFRCVIVDPPWPVAKIEREERPNQGPELDYPTMSLQEIEDSHDKNGRHITDLFDPNGCHVYLWTTNKLLPAALDILGKWGVKYQCTLAWVKNVGITPFSFMYNLEFVLFGRVGNLPLLECGVKQSFEGSEGIKADSGRHSEKPDSFYDLVLKVSPEPRLDMFARRKREGFDVWGNEV